jgi:hypothetical protein
MGPRAKGPEPGRWKYQVGEPPLLLTAFERIDKGLAIYTRIWDGEKYREKKPLCASIRDERQRIIPERETAAQQLAIRRHSELVSGIDREETVGGALTLAGGFRRLLDKKKGKYPVETEHRKEVARASLLILEVLGRDRPMNQIRHRDYRTIWRHMANAHVKEPSRYGLRSAELYCGALQLAARWLQQEGHLEPGDAMPAPTWKTELRAEWAQITSKPIRKPDKPRYTDAESLALWDALPSADPRLVLATELGAEHRLGQVARIRRSDVLPSKRYRCGRLQVHGRGKKLGETITLTRRQRHALTASILWGYLADAEAAYRKGEIEDYFLIAGGKLHRSKDHRGRPVLRTRVRFATAGHLGRTGLAEQWERLEKRANVAHIEGRLWYGMRRLQADKSDALKDVSAKAKNRMGGWSRTSTRELYLDQGNVRDEEEAAKARERIRPPRGSK